MTKKYEEAWQTTFEGALEKYGKQEPKGEFVIVIEGRAFEEKEEEERKNWEEMSMEDHVDYYIAQGMDRKEAMEAAAKDRGISKRDVYQQSFTLVGARPDGGVSIFTVLAFYE